MLFPNRIALCPESLENSVSEIASQDAEEPILQCRPEGVPTEGYGAFALRVDEANVFNLTSPLP
jgi:hypothetical protein